MTACFADSFYFFALLNSRDEAHEAAVRITSALRRPILTTARVLTEVGDGLATTPARGVLAPLVQRLRAHSQTTIVAPTESLFTDGIRLYTARSDKHWSLTDCISMVVMQRQGVADVLTGDHHFQQAGFNLLF